MSVSLERQISQMTGGDHACLIYDTYEQQMAAVLPFVKAGLEKNEACLYIAHERPLDEIKNAFRAYGINVDHEIKRGALQFTSNNMRSDGAFDPGAMVDILDDLVTGAISKGFSGFRASGEMTWVLGESCGCDRLIEYESLLNERFPSTLTGICQYNRQRFDPEIIRDILRNHPVIIIGQKVCRNLYCESHKVVNGHMPADFGVGWMLDNLAQFNVLEETLRNMIQMRDQFIAIAGHELKTPLTSIKMQNDLRLMEQEYGKAVTTESWKKYIEVTDRQLRHLIGIVDDMLDVTSIAHGPLLIDPQPGVDLVDLVKTHIQRFQGTPSAPSIDLQAPDQIIGNWDPMRLGQVVANLLSNAVKYGQNEAVEVELYSKSGRAILQVKDRGIGIAPGDQQRIFQLYERAILHTAISGFGLGLYIADQVVKAHRGRIRVESVPGKGSTFIVDLPL